MVFLDGHQDAMKSTGYRMDSNLSRGQLVPMGTLQHPAPLRALRLAYPTLCVGSNDGDLLWLWDIRTREIIQTIDLGRHTIHYLDVNETHAFVGTDSISIYSRLSGNCVFKLRTSTLEPIISHVLRPTTRIFLPNSTFENYVLKPCRDPSPIYSRSNSLQFVTVVQVSPSGDNFVALTTNGILVHVGGLKGTDLIETPYSLDRFRISVASLDRSVFGLAYDGDRILVDGVSLISRF